MLKQEAQAPSAQQRYKALEREMSRALPKEGYCAIRLDGKSFGTFTKQYRRPYDDRFMASMDAAALAVIEHVLPSALIGYVQSDEITIVISALTSKAKDIPFGGRIEKLLSTTASAATAGFLRCDPDVEGMPIFDARITLLDSLEDVQAHLDWRRLDAQKNAVSMAAGTLRSHAELKGVPTRERRELLKGTPLEWLPAGFYNGRLVVRRSREAAVEYIDRRTMEKCATMTVVNRWDCVPALRDATEEEVAALADRLAPQA